MRGKDKPKKSEKLSTRITPAHAGKSIFPFLKVIYEEDHPRTCGEKYPYEREESARDGITPAHAGKRK